MRRRTRTTCPPSVSGPGPGAGWGGAWPPHSASHGPATPLPAAKLGRQHPDRVVETSTLSSVPPPDVTYSLALPASDSGALSALQLEAITYACQVSSAPEGRAQPRPQALTAALPPQQHEVLLPSGQRAGFLIGDGAGVGKGRTVAGIILENHLRGRKKALW